MKKLLALAAVASVTAFAAPAFADTSASLGWTEWTIADFDANTITGTASWNQGHFGVQVEGAYGISNTKVVNPGSGHTDEFSIRSEMGVFATAQFDVADNFAIAARAGLATVNAKERDLATNTHQIDNNGGPAYGVSATWMFSEATGLRLDSPQYNVDLGKDLTKAGFPPSYSNEDLSTISLSLVRKFGLAKPAAPAEAPK